MSISVTCSGCGTRLSAPEDAHGKRVKCPKCGAAVPVPAAEKPSPARSEFVCPVCRVTISAPASLEGADAPCPKCGADVDRWPAPVGRSSSAPAPSPLPEDLPEEEEAPRKRPKKREDEPDEDRAPRRGSGRRRAEDEPPEKVVKPWMIATGLGALVALSLLSCGGLFALGVFRKRGVESAENQTLYTIKLSDRLDSEQKWAVHRVEERTNTVTPTKGAAVVTSKGAEESFVQTVISPKVKLTRAYTIATQTHNGVTKNHPYAGAVVTIEKRDGIFSFTMNSRQLTPADAPELFSEFDGKGGEGLANRLPKSPVKVNEQWIVDRDELRKLARRSTLSLDVEKSTMTGRLTKAYTSEGIQWGVIEWREELVFSGARERFEPDKATVSVTLEGPIDGAVGEEKQTLRWSAFAEEQDPTVGRIKVEMKSTITTTYRPVR